MTNTAPRFTVLLFIPSYNDRDGIEFYSGRVVGTAMTEGWARAIAAKHDGEGMDETYVEVRRAGETERLPFIMNRWGINDAAADDDCPF